MIVFLSQIKTPIHFFVQLLNHRSFVLSSCVINGSKECLESLYFKWVEHKWRQKCLYERHCEWGCQKRRRKAVPGAEPR